MEICEGGFFDVKCLRDPDSSDRHIYISGWNDTAPGECTIDFSSPMINEFIFSAVTLNSDGLYSLWKLDAPLYSEVDSRPAIARLAKPIEVCVPKRNNNNDGFEIISKRGWKGIPKPPCNNDDYPVELTMIAVPESGTRYTVRLK